MKTTWHERIKAIFAAACDVEPRCRDAVLDELCDGDDALRREVESLLEHDAAPRVDLEDAASSLGHHLASDASLRVPATMPRVIGDFRVVDVLGEGGMGVVYLAEQDHPRRTVALKVVRPGLGTEAMRRRFRREAEVLGRMQHVGIAQIFEAGEAPIDDGPRCAYFAMEHVPGLPLTRHARDFGLSIRDRIRLIVQVCAAVQHAHQHGVVHRDLKPSNILVCPPDDKSSIGDAPPIGQVKVLDFGIARPLHLGETTEAGPTITGQLIGTLAYMSREQVDGDARTVDARSDVYSLGVIAYELLAERRPFVVEDLPVLDAVRIVRDDDPPSLGSIDRTLRGDLETIVAKAMDKDPARRYPSALEFAADLERYLRDEPIRARPASTLYQVRKLVSRHRGLAAALAAVLLVLVAGVATAGAGWAAAATEAGRARDSAEATEAVNHFLKTMLGSASPYETADPDVSMREVLDDASRQLETAFPAQPLVRAELHLTLGQTYRELGLRPEAQDHIEAALAVRRRILEPDDPRIAQALHDLSLLHNHAGEVTAALGYADEAIAIMRPDPRRDLTLWFDLETQRASLLSALGRRDEAGAAFRAVIAERRRAEPDGSLGLAAALNDYGIHLDQTAADAESEQAHLEALAMVSRIAGPDSLDAALSHSNLAALYSDTGRYDEAYAQHEAALRIREARLRPDHPSLAVERQNLGMLLSTMGRYDEADAMLRASIESHRRRRPEGGTSLAIALKALADVRGAVGDGARAIEYLTEAVGMMRGNADIRADLLAGALNSLALRYAELGDFDQADALMDEAIAAVEQSPARDAGALASLGHTRGTMLINQSRFAEALPILETAMKAYREAYPDDGLRLAYFHNNIAICAMRTGDVERAEREMRMGLDIRREALPPDHPDVIMSMENYAGLLRRMGRAAEAKPLILDALASATKTLPPDHFMTGYAWRISAEVHDALDEVEAAGAAYEEALRIYRIVRGPRHFEVAGLLSDYGAFLAHHDRVEEAEARLVEALSLFETETRLAPTHLIECLRRLADVRDASHRTDDAETLRARATALEQDE